MRPREDAVPGRRVEDAAIAAGQPPRQPPGEGQPDVRLRCQAQPVRRPEKGPAAGSKHAGGFGQNGFGVSDMFDDIAAMNAAESAVGKGQGLPFAADEPDIVQAGFVKPFASQQQPTHGDIHSDDRPMIGVMGECDQRRAGTAAKVENRRIDGRGSIETAESERGGSSDDVPYLALHVSRAQLRAVPLVISGKKGFERTGFEVFQEVRGDFAVASVTAVRVLLASQVDDTGKTCPDLAAGAIDLLRIPVGPWQIAPAGRATKPGGHLSCLGRATVAGPSSSQAVTTRPTAARLAAEHLSAVSSTVCQCG